MRSPYGGWLDLSKKDDIIKFHANNTNIKSKEIAFKYKTTPAYVYNCISKHRKSNHTERWSKCRSGGLSQHGLSFYEDHILPSWYDDLGVPVVNGKTGMKQIGSKGLGDPCSAQFHKSGKVIVYVHGIGWRYWLRGQLVKYGWDRDRGILLVDYGLKFEVCNIEISKAKSGRYLLPKGFRLETNWGFVICRDNTPEKGSLEMKVSVPNMKKYLGLSEIQKNQQLIFKKLREIKARLS